MIFNKYVFQFSIHRVYSKSCLGVAKTKINYILFELSSPLSENSKMQTWIVDAVIKWFVRLNESLNEKILRVATLDACCSIM